MLFTHSERKFYSCDHVLPSDGPCRKLSIKVLDIVTSASVWVFAVCVCVCVCSCL